MGKIDRQKVYEKCGGRCGYCGTEISFKEMQVDHIISQFHYRLKIHKKYTDNEDMDDFSNLLATCRVCNKWKSSYTAYRDIYDAVLSNKTAYDRYLKGELNPEDLMSSIRKRREGEALSPFTGRPQTKAAALGSGLDLLGYKEPVPYNFLTTLPKVAAGVTAKPVQSFMYSKPGQELLYKGLGQTGLAPYIGSVPEKVAKKER